MIISFGMNMHTTVVNMVSTATKYMYIDLVCTGLFFKYGKYNQHQICLFMPNIGLIQLQR